VAHMAGTSRAPYVPLIWAPIMLLVKYLPEPLFQRVKAFSAR
jgi:hypothetical protein